MGAVPTSPTPARGPGIIVSREAAAVCTPAHWPSWVLGPWKVPELSLGPAHQCSAATRPQTAALRTSGGGSWGPWASLELGHPGPVSG